MPSHHINHIRQAFFGNIGINIFLSTAVSHYHKAYSGIFQQLGRLHHTFKVLSLTYIAGKHNLESFGHQRHFSIGCAGEYIFRPIGEIYQFVCKVSFFED